MTTLSITEIPPRPSWMRPAQDSPPAERPPEPPPPVLPRDEPVPDDVKQRRVLRGVGNASTGVLVSAVIHLAILLGLNIWLFVTRAGPSGYVIQCEIRTDDDGAETEVQTVVQEPLPDEPPPGDDTDVDVQPAGGAGEGELARIGAGGAGEGAGAGGGGVGFFGTKAGGNSFVFVVDRSGSMKNGRLTAAKRELNRAIGSLRVDQRFYVLFYNSDMERMLSPDPPAGLVFATPEMRDEVRAWMRPVLASGGTEPAESLHTALEMRPDVIFFLTDGEIPDETDDVVRAANFHGTVIHTTALVSQGGEAVLQQIAADNGGTYRHIAAVLEDARNSPAEADTSQFTLVQWELEAEADQSQLTLVQRERAAEAKLRLARRYLRDGRPRTGRRWLEQVVSEYPGTSQATEAEQLLSAL